MKTVFSILLTLWASSAVADGAFSISAIINNEPLVYCKGITSEKVFIAPAHCFKSASQLYIHNMSNPIIATKIVNTTAIKSYDLATISVKGKPPIGELAQRAVFCSTHPMQNQLYAHSCNNLHGGDSGTLIYGKNITLMHLGIIKINGKSFGFGLDYRSIIKHIDGIDGSNTP